LFLALGYGRREDCIRDIDMPWIVPMIPALIGAGTAGTEIGLSASGALSPSTSGATKDAARLQAEMQQKQQQQQEQAAFKRFAPDAQAQTGGALGDQSLSAMIAELSGSPADTNLAQQTVFGNPPGLSSGSPTGG
jgi:hypothetical protein